MTEHRIIKRILYVLLAVFILISYFGIGIYKKAYRPNVVLKTGYTHLYIPTGSDFDDVMSLIKEIGCIKNYRSFKWVVEKKNYSAHIHPGRYKIKRGMSNNEFVNMLRQGAQDPVQLTFNNVRLMENLASKISTQIEADEESLKKLYTNEGYIADYGFNRQTIPSMFIPNTYEFWWNTNDTVFFERMYGEYEKFWTNARTRKAEKIGLSKIKVSILASIIDEETNKNDEKARIAGVYINRLNQRIPLSADPTVKFAWRDFSIKRVLNRHLLIDSPYNTYIYYGLPPGPIRIPSIEAIDAVLEYEKHNYLYFCAKADFSGYHNFSKTLEQHNHYAALYRQALNKRRIYR